MLKKRAEVEKQLKKDMRSKFIELSDEKLKPFEKLRDRYWAEEFEKKLTDEEIKT